MRTMLLLALATSACISPPSDKTLTGPTIRVTLDPDSGFEASSDESNPYLSLPTNATQYSFALIVETSRGTSYDGTDYNNPDVTTANATMTLAGATIPPLTLTIDDTMYDRQFVSQKIMIPSSFKNSSIAVHGDAHDAMGLSSNIVNFNCLLR